MEHHPRSGEIFLIKFLLILLGWKLRFISKQDSRAREALVLSGMHSTTYSGGAICPAPRGKIPLTPFTKGGIPALTFHKKVGREVLLPFLKGGWEGFERHCSNVLEKSVAFHLSPQGGAGQLEDFSGEVLLVIGFDEDLLDVLPFFFLQGRPGFCFEAAHA